MIYAVQVVKRIPEKVWEILEQEYINTCITTRELANKHNIAISTIRRESARREWSKKREISLTAEDRVVIRRAKAARKLSTQEMIENLLSQLEQSMYSVEARSLEGVASSAEKLMRYYDELFPRDIDGIIDLMIKQDISPADFISAYRARMERDVAESPKRAKI